MLSKPDEVMLNVAEQEIEKNKTFDLLDALSKSGVLDFRHASLHVMVCATHCFDKVLMDTLVKDNVNPIEKLERSVVIMATTIHQKNAEQLIQDDQYERLGLYSPSLFSHSSFNQLEGSFISEKSHRVKEKIEI